MTIGVKREVVAGKGKGCVIEEKGGIGLDVKVDVAVCGVFEVESVHGDVDSAFIPTKCRLVVSVIQGYRDGVVAGQDECKLWFELL